MNNSGFDRLSVTDLITAAEYATGAFGVADASLTARITAIVKWASSVDYSEDRLRGVRVQLQRLISKRLLIQADRQRFPGIASERIERPVFVVGYPRTGTSLIQALLASDPARNAVQAWQTREPSPPPFVVPVSGYRRMMAATEVDAFVRAAPGVLALHRYWDQRDECLVEDEEIFTLDFQNVYCALLYNLPSPRALIAPRDPLSAYNFLKEFLQHQQWGAPAQTGWVLKGTMHQLFLDTLFSVFPDARCIWTHREPMEVHASNLAITAACWDDLNDWKIDWRQFAQGYRQAVTVEAAAAVANPWADDPRVTHIRFTDFASNPLQMMEDIYGKWGDPLTPDTRDAMQGWLDDPNNDSNRYGRRSYPLAPFDLTEADFGAAFDGYRDRFLR